MNIQKIFKKVESEIEIKSGSSLELVIGWRKRWVAVQIELEADTKPCIYNHDILRGYKDRFCKRCGESLSPPNIQPSPERHNQ